MRKILFFLFYIFWIVFLYSVPTKIKDISNLSGFKTNELIGYGIVIGLNGTGDKGKDFATVTSVINMLEKFGLKIPLDKIETNNCAAVIVSSTLPPTFEEGERIDVTVSSIGNAKSLFGGQLLVTPLYAGNGEVYAYAKGAINVGGYNVEINNNKVEKNISTNGFIPNGATICKTYNEKIIEKEEIILYLNNNNFNLVNNIITAINERYNSNIATTDDGKKIIIKIPEQYKEKKYTFIAEFSNLQIDVEPEPIIVIDEKSGNVIVGGNINVGEVAISHGNLHISVNSNNVISQPYPFSYGTTIQTIESKMVVIEDKGNFTKVKSGTTIDEIIAGLNKMGVTSKDIISILINMKVAGAIKGQIIVR